MCHVRWTSCLGPSTNQGTIKLQKTSFPDAGPNEMGNTVAVSNHNCCILINVVGKLSLLNQTELQQECEFNSGNSENPFTEEKDRTGGSSATSVNIGADHQFALRHIVGFWRKIVCTAFLDY